MPTPQETGGIDLWHGMSALGGAIIGGLISLAGMIYRAGGKHPSLNLQFQKSISDAEERVEQKIAGAQRQNDDKLEDLVTQFHESFSGIRQKINDVELSSERRFLSQKSFEDFRTEYRDDIRRIFEKLDGRKSH